jgi:hypothetical protein
MFRHQITNNAAIKYLEILVRFMVLLPYIGCDICYLCKEFRGFRQPLQTNFGIVQLITPQTVSTETFPIDIHTTYDNSTLLQAK